jgi:hypothetical protein
MWCHERGHAVNGYRWAALLLALLSMGLTVLGVNAVLAGIDIGGLGIGLGLVFAMWAGIAVGMDRLD